MVLKSSRKYTPYLQIIASYRYRFLPSDEFISILGTLISDFVVFLPPLRLLSQSEQGDLAHLVERQVRNLKVAGSSPVISTE